MNSITVEALPRFESYYFGLDTCAMCLDTVKRSTSQRRKFKDPIMDGETILVPAGTHRICPACILVLPKEKRGSK